MIKTLTHREIEMSKQKQPAREPRTYEFWGGKPLKRTTSDLFLDRPRPTNMVFTGIFLFFFDDTYFFFYLQVLMLFGINVTHLVN